MGQLVQNGDTGTHNRAGKENNYAARRNFNLTCSHRYYDSDQIEVPHLALVTARLAGEAELSEQIDPCLLTPLLHLLGI